MSLPCTWRWGFLRRRGGGDQGKEEGERVFVGKGGLVVGYLLLPLLILACLLRSLSLASPQRWITVDVGPMACISIIS